MLRTIDRNHYLPTFLFALFCVSAVFFIVIFPDRIFQASLQGLEIWWQIVFPALLPFLILTELLAGYRFFHAIGKLFRPMMTFLFRLPGEAAWAFITGIAAGFPAGAHATIELRKQGKLSLKQSEQLLALSHFCSPILMMHVVAVGFFNNVRLGWMLITIQLVSLFITGLLMRGIKLRRPNTEQAAIIEEPTEQYAELDAGFGKKLGDAVMSSIQKLMGIGGVMIVFAVTIELIKLTLSFLQRYIGLTEGAVSTTASAIFEVHLGTYQISEQVLLPFILQVALLSALFGWSGISAHLQAQSIARHAGLRYRSFLLTRFVHACVAFMTTLLLWNPLNFILPQSAPSFLPIGGTRATSTISLWISGWSTLLTMFIGSLVGLALLSLVCKAVQTVREK